MPCVHECDNFPWRNVSIWSVMVSLAKCYYRKYGENLLFALCSCLPNFSWLTHAHCWIVHSQEYIRITITDLYRIDDLLFMMSAEMGNRWIQFSQFLFVLFFFFFFFFLSATVRMGDIMAMWILNGVRLHRLRSTQFNARNTRNGYFRQHKAHFCVCAILFCLRVRN